MNEEKHYVCNNCKKVFTEPATRKDHEEYWGRMVPVEYDCCPYCGGDFETVYEESEDEE